VDVRRRVYTDLAYEHDACGVAFVADLAGRRDHGIVQKALTALRNLEAVAGAARRSRGRIKH
jgi:glutamate synthase domain-containing protein 1